MTEYTGVDRRTVIQGIGGLAVVGALAGCSTDGGDTGGDGVAGDGGDGGDGGDSDGGDGGSAEVDDYLSETGNYDGTIQDMTGQDEVTVDVGAEGNGGNYAFAPPAIRVDQGTTVVWEWTGQGSIHDVTHEDGEFESQQTAEEGFTFEHTFDESGTYLYVCTPHEPLGMKGAVVVE